MYLKRVAGLAGYLAEGEKSVEELAKFLVLKTFVDLSPRALYLAEIVDDGYLSPVAGFGFDKMVIAQWGRFPLSMHLPITECVRLDECVVVRSPEDFLSNYPVTREFENVSTDWTAVMAFPMLPYGVGFMILDSQPGEDEELSHFARAIGSLLALQFSKIPVYGGVKANGGKKNNGYQNIELSERQKIIHSLMSQGFTNAQIAAEVGYSESLVRQETIQIFRVLGVSGRKEIIESGAKVS
jgi:DNA-binding CsgD family transcriptional regulator